MHQPPVQRHNLFPSPVASNLMLSAYLLKYSSKLRLNKRSQEIYTDRMPTGDSGGLTSRAFTMLTWRV